MKKLQSQIQDIPIFPDYEVFSRKTDGRSGHVFRSLVRVKGPVTDENLSKWYQVKVVTSKIGPNSDDPRPHIKNCHQFEHIGVGDMQVTDSDGVEVCVEDLCQDSWIQLYVDDFNKTFCSP